MIKETVIRAIGNSSGVTIPKPMLDRSPIRQGDTVYALEVENGILLTAFDPTFGDVMDAYREGKHRYRNAMKDLADKRPNAPGLDAMDEMTVNRITARGAIPTASRRRCRLP